MADKRSPIWELFSFREDTKFAKCETCGENIDRGGKSTKTYMPTNLVTHLKTRHQEQFTQFEKRKKEKEVDSTKKNAQPSLVQLTLKETSDRVRPWDINDSRAQAVHRRIMEMIALDFQPILIVEDPGFT